METVVSKFMVILRLYKNVQKLLANLQKALLNCVLLRSDEINISLNLDLFLRSRFSCKARWLLYPLVTTQEVGRQHKNKHYCMYTSKINKIIVEASLSTKLIYHTGTN